MQAHNDSDLQFPRLFLSIGAMKAGTTWLSQVLRRHPQVHVSPEKEIHFLYHWYVDRNFLSMGQRPMRAAQVERRYQNAANPKVKATVEDWLQRYRADEDGWDWYRSLLTAPRPNAYPSDFSNLSCHISAEDWQDVARHVEVLKVLYVLRNPYERLWSHVRFHLGLEGRTDEIGTWDEAEFLRFVQVDHIWKNNNYAANIAALETGLGKDLPLVLFYDDVENDKYGTLARIAHYLGIRNIWTPGSLEAVVEKRINVSPEVKRPPYFYDALRPFVTEEIERLEALGYTVPDAWRR